MVVSIWPEKKSFLLKLVSLFLSFDKLRIFHVRNCTTSIKEQHKLSLACGPTFLLDCTFDTIYADLLHWPNCCSPTLVWCLCDLQIIIDTRHLTSLIVFPSGKISLWKVVKLAELPLYWKCTIQYMWTMCSRLWAGENLCK